jgi:ribosomal protein S18 acetylase RimI-like enzyme
VILPLEQEHVDQVAQLHRASLTGLLSDLGLPAIKAFYAGCLRTDLAIGLVEVEGRSVRGFVFGSPHPEELRPESFRANRIRTLVALGLGVVRHPILLGSLLRVGRVPEREDYNRTSPELIYLAVSKSSRGSGVGAQLVKAFTAEILKRGVSGYELSVDEDNSAAIAFYEREGFKLIGRYREFGVAHRRYRFG